jgi:hypothetical protein
MWAAALLVLAPLWLFVVVLAFAACRASARAEAAADRYGLREPQARRWHTHALTLAGEVCLEEHCPDPPSWDVPADLRVPH